MGPESPKPPPDYIDWERFRRTKEYERFVVAKLRNSITAAKYPDWDMINQSEEITDFNASLQELRTIEQVRRFCQTNKNPKIQAINIEAEIQKAEELYPTFVSFAHEHGDRVRKAMREAFAEALGEEGEEDKGDKDKEEKVQ